MTVTTEVSIDVGRVVLDGTFALPERPHGLVVFAHGSGSSRHSPRNRAVAEVLQHASIATLLLDLLTVDEERERSNVFDVELLAERLDHAIHWVRHDTPLVGLPIGLFGASTGAAAALVAAAYRATGLAAVVSRGGRPDLAGDALESVRTPTLLIVGGADTDVLDVNERAANHLAGPHELLVITGATHLFEEPGALEAVGAAAADWFTTWFEEASERRPVAQ